MRLLPIGGSRSAEIGVMGSSRSKGVCKNAEGRYNSPMHPFKTGCGGAASTRISRGVPHRLGILVWFGLLLCLEGCGLGGTPPGAVVGRAGRWDYSPSVIQTGHVQQFWWCGEARNPAKPSQDTDTIMYEAIDLVSGKQVGPFVVLAETPGAWDSAYTCNPKVVQGKFSNPLGDGQTYTYALYYVGTPNVGGGANSIGVAFSNDGQTWKKYPSPVIETTNINYYGAAQPVAYNSDGKQAITLFYEDDLPPSEGDYHWEAVSSDGVHFKNIGLLTTNGLNLVSNRPTWADMAYNMADGYWYALYNTGSRATSTVGGIMEFGQWGFQLYRIPSNDLLIGKTGWQELKTFDTNLTGYESNFLAGLLGDGYGNLYQDGSGTVQMFPSFSNVQVGWDESPTSAAKNAKNTNWDIGEVFWSPNDATLYELNRYLHGASHRVTTGWIDTTVFTLEKTLGQVYASPKVGATVALYGCKTGNTDAFVSLDSGCEGQYMIGLNGYIYGVPPAGVAVVPIYRCSTNHDHFVSTDPACEGSHIDELLGYILPVSR